MKHWSRYVLALIFGIGLFLRLWQLPNIPVGLHGDEASIGYNAYSLLKTGRDQNGVRLPLAIDQFGDFRPAGYHYLDVPFVKFLGLNALAVRLPSAIFGALTILAIYLFVRELFSSHKHASYLSLLSSFYLAISPWHINISRATSEGVIAGFFIILGSYLLLRGVKKTSSPILILSLSFTSFFVSFLFYHSARLFVPVFLIPFVVYLFTAYKPQRDTKRIVILGAIILFVFLGALMKFSQGAARPTTVSIFQIPGGDQQIYQQIGEDGTRPALVTRFLHNKLLFYGRLFLASYFWHFNGEFLFAETGKPVRYSIPWSSNMYLVDLPLLLLGGAALLIDGLRKRKYYLLVPLAWLAIGALPAGLTWEDLPNVQRASLMIPGLLMLCAYGLLTAGEFFKNKLIQKGVTLLYLALLFYGCISFYHNYFYHLPRHEPWHRSAAAPELLEVLSSFQEQGLPIVATTESNNNFIFYLFYRAFDPARFQQMGSPKESDGLVFDGVRYTAQPCPLGSNSESPDNNREHVGVVFVNKATCKTPINAEVLSTIRTTDGIPAFLVVKINPDWKP